MCVGGVTSLPTKLSTGIVDLAVRHNDLQVLFRGFAEVLSIIQAAGWPIWPLLACSVLAMALVIERFWSLRTRRILGSDVLTDIATQVRHGLPPDDSVSQWEQQSTLGGVLCSSLRALERHPTCSESDLRNAMQTAGRLAAHRMERYLTALATIASAAPLLGLLGTVVGMIELFGAQAPAGSANPAQLAQGISMALYNTAFGLMVAIPALIFWRYFRARVDAYLLTMEAASEQLIAQINALRRATP